MRLVTARVSKSVPTRPPLLLLRAPRCWRRGCLFAHGDVTMRPKAREDVGTWTKDLVALSTTVISCGRSTWTQ